MYAQKQQKTTKNQAEREDLRRHFVLAYADWLDLTSHLTWAHLRDK